MAARERQREQTLPSTNAVPASPPTTSFLPMPPAPVTARAPPARLAGPVPFAVPSATRLAYERAIQNAHREISRVLPSGQVVVTGSAALWLADKEATWLPDDIDIPVLAGMYYDLIGRLSVLSYKRVKPEGSGYSLAFKVPGTDKKIAVQLYPVHNIKDSIAAHDLEAVRCYAEQAGNVAMRVRWIAGTDPNKVLTERRTFYYRPTACTRRGCQGHETNRTKKYVERGFTVEPVTCGLARCPYCDARRGKPWRTNRAPALREVKASGCPINGLTLVGLGYETPYTNKVALRWLEQEWIRSGCILGREELIALATPPPPPCPVNGAVLRAHNVAAVDCAAFGEIAQQLWLRSGCTLTEQQLLIELGVGLASAEPPSSPTTDFEAVSAPPSPPAPDSILPPLEDTEGCAIM
jgi:hypothetical protein